MGGVGGGGPSQAPSTWGMSISKSTISWRSGASGRSPSCPVSSGIASQVGGISDWPGWIDGADCAPVLVNRKHRMSVCRSSQTRLRGVSDGSQLWLLFLEGWGVE